MADEFYDLGFSDIYGAETGQAQNLSNLIQSFFNTLKTGEYFGPGFKGDLSTNFLLGEHGMGPDEQGYYGAEDPLSKFIDIFSTATSSDNPVFSKMTQEEKEGYESLGSLLDKFKSKNIVGGYMQDIGDVGSEFASEKSLLGKSLTTTGKGGRYGALQTGGRMKGGVGRKKYLSDFYSLLGQEQELTSGLQTGVESDVNKLLIDFMATTSS